MPTPRPASSVSASAVEKPGSKISSAASWSDGASPSASRPLLLALARMRVQVEAGAVVGEAQLDLVALLADLHQQLAGFRLAVRQRGARAARCRARSRCAAGVRKARPCVPARCGRSPRAPPRMSRLTRLSVSLAVWRATRNRRSDRLAKGTMRTRIRSRCSSRVRRDCAARSSLALSTVRARLSWNERDVVHALGHHARQFLQAREAVEFERVEFALAGDRQARRDLRLGLHLDFAQLAAQAGQVVREVVQRALQRADFVFQARARDRHFAGLVDQAVEDVGAHAHQRRARGLAVVGAGWAGAAARAAPAAARPRRRRPAAAAVRTAASPGRSWPAVRRRRPGCWCRRAACSRSGFPARACAGPGASRRPCARCP